jgi:integrase
LSTRRADLRPLRFHDLRHSFGSLVVREVDTATLKAWMGHAKLTTTVRYLHSKPRHMDRSSEQVAPPIAIEGKRRGADCAPVDARLAGRRS